MANWESLIGAKIEAHRDTHKVCKVEDARERSKRRREAAKAAKMKEVA